MTLYKIANWQLYENHETRKMPRLLWFPSPNDFDGASFRYMTQEADSAALFGAWNCIVRVASRSEQGDRGVLIRKGRPLDATDLSIMSGFPVSVFERALSFFSQGHIGWLLADEWQHELPLLPGLPGLKPAQPCLKPTEWKEGMEGKKEHGAPPAPPVRARARDECFEVLCELTSADFRRMTKPERGKVNGALAAIRTAETELTPQMLRLAAASYKRLHPDWPLTANALASHWSELTTRDTVPRPIPEPQSWRDRMRHDFPGWVGLTDGRIDLPWDKLSPLDRKTISQMMTTRTP